MSKQVIIIGGQQKASTIALCKAAVNASRKAAKVKAIFKKLVYAKKRPHVEVVLSIPSLIERLEINIDSNVQVSEPRLLLMIESAVLDYSNKLSLQLLNDLKGEIEKFHSEHQDKPRKLRYHLFLNLDAAIGPLDIRLVETTSCQNRQNVHSEQQAIDENHQQN
jgi:hypothetical protein